MADTSEQEAMNIAVQPKFYFYLSNGQIIKNLNELSDVIASMDDFVFYNHVTPYKNDFAKWIYEVFRLDDLSQKLGPVKSKDEISRVLKAYLAQKNVAEQNIQKTVIQNATIPRPPAELPQIKIEKIQEPEIRREINTEKQPIIQPQPILKTTSGITDHRVFVWKTTESVSLTSKPIPKTTIEIKKIEPKQQEIKKPEIKHVEIKLPEPKPFEKIQGQIKETKPEPKIELKIEPIKINQKPFIDNITDADLYFEKNPILLSQVIDAKKKNLALEPLELIKYNGAETPEQLIEIFKDTYSKSYQRLSFMRKNGFETNLAEMMLFRIPSKIKVYEASKENKDSIVIKRYLNEIIEELNNMKR